MRAIVEGTNFRFGRARMGDVGTLDQLCRAEGIGFEQVSATLEGNDPISSSRIRAALTEGNVELANQLLGREYAITGQVTTGAKRGRTIGVPTANLDGVTTMLPKEGVYAGRVTVDGQDYPTAINLGPEPDVSRSTAQNRSPLARLLRRLVRPRTSTPFRRSTA